MPLRPGNVHGTAGVAVARRGKLASPLKPTARTGDGYRLVHNPFPHAQILVDPLCDLLVFAGYFLGLETRSGKSQRGCVLDRLTAGNDVVMP
jgi:hypothetical protein